MPATTTTRSLRVIATEIRSTWSPVNFAAEPYLDAMGTLDRVTDVYICDTGTDMVTYFLGNAGTWRGDDAKRIKSELKSMIGRK